MKVMYELVDPINEEHVGFLYDLLKERPPEANISHKELPTFAQHAAFVARYPYAFWYIIIADGSLVGSVYVTKHDEIGIHIYTPFRRKGLARQAIRWLIITHNISRPLANVAPGNLKSHALFTGLGGTVIQHTYLLDGAHSA